MPWELTEAPALGQHWHNLQHQKRGSAPSEYCSTHLRDQLLSGFVWVMLCLFPSQSSEPILILQLGCSYSDAKGAHAIVASFHAF